MANMKVTGLLSDETILAALGQRLAQLRIERGMTQAQLANEAGVAKRTVERVESGESIQLLTLVRLARVLGLMEHIGQLVPEQMPSPMALLKDKTRQKSPKRARSRKSAPVLKSGESTTWTWGDDA
jgi:transcriptional regulator with XRE-family HTH domain